jgi:hypothetical protein
MRAPLLHLPALLGLAAAPACGGKAAPSTGAIENRAGAGGTTPAPSISLADDLAELTRAAREGDQQSAWPERATFLGWTADHRAAYRVLVCNPDELGGRGPFCELQVCTATEVATYEGPSCEDAAQFELYGEIDFDAAGTAAAAEASVGALGPLALGTPRPLTAAAVDTTGRGLAVRIFDRAHELLPATDDRLGVAEARVTFVADSPDGRCRAVLGDASVLGEYEGVEGHIPFLFAAVGCQ